MHMADALLSPAVGLAMWGASAACLAISARRVRASADDRMTPLMGVLGAFVFAAQMVNFAIPGTGSSGHLGGGLLLAVLLGPHAALIVIASVLSVQALFFADGGLLALGANIFNLGVLPCWVAYPLVFRPLAGRQAAGRRLGLAALVAGVVALQLGAAGVVLQTVASGISSLPLEAFGALMLGIHVAIGAVEGLATAAILSFLLRAQPELLAPRTPAAPAGSLRLPLGLAAAFTGIVLSAFASGAPDGLEWSVEHAAVKAEGQAQAGTSATPWHHSLGSLQERLAWMPEYTLRSSSTPPSTAGPADEPAFDAGTSLAGLVGGLLVLGVASVAAMVLAVRRRHPPER